MERRKAELSLTDPSASDLTREQAEESVEDPEFARSISWDVGGANRLSGASYFWFFTPVMLGGDRSVPIGYSPTQEYLQQEPGTQRLGGGEISSECDGAPDTAQRPPVLMSMMIRGCPTGSPSRG